MSPTFVLWLALVVGIVGFSDRASADWQGTVWGMSREEANKGLRIPHRDGEEFNPYTYTNFDSYTTDDLTFSSGALVFLRDRLARITMNLTNAGQCDSLLETLRRIYGKPASDGKKPILGYFVEHTVIADIGPKARIFQEEIFGPVLAVTKAKNFDDALHMANDTEFGLTGAVYSQNSNKIERAAEEFHVGNLYMNRKCTGAMVGAHPFGGFNMSGTDSKSGGQDYLLLFLQAKTIAEKVGATK